MDFSFKENITGADTHQMWLDRVENALQWRMNHWNGDTAWRRYLRLFRGDHWDGNSSFDIVSSDNVRDRITVNLTGSTIVDTLPFLVRQRPQFMAKPTRPEFAVSARLQEAVLNYEWKERAMQRQLKRAVQDAAIIGHGIIKTGYELELDNTAASLKDGSIEYRDYVLKDSPYIRRISPFHFGFDPEAPEGDLESARWCYELVFTPVADMLANASYNKAAINAIKTGTYEPRTVNSYKASHGDTNWRTELQEVDSTRVVKFIIWDKKFRKYYVFAAGVPIPLREESEWPFEYMKGFPYEKLDFIPLPDEPYGIGIPAWIEDSQHELNRVRTRMFDHGRRFNRKYIAVQGQIEEEEYNKLLEGEDGTVVEAKTTEAIKPIEDAHMSSDQYNLENTIKNDIRELTGADALLRGGNLPSRTSATEIGQRANMVGLKMEDRVEGVDNFVRNIGRKTLAHIKANFTGERVIQIAGPEGEYWETFTSDDIQAEVDIDLESTSKPKVDPQIDRQQRLQVFQTIMQALPLLLQTGVKINMGELFKWFLSSFDDKEVMRFFPDAGVIGGPLHQLTAIMAQQGGQGGQAPAFGQAAPPAGAPAPVNPLAQLAGQQGQQAGAGGLNSNLLGALLGGMSGQQ